MERIQPPSDVINAGLSRLRYSAVPAADVEIVDPQNAAEILEKRQANAGAELTRWPARDHTVINDWRPDECTLIHYPGLAVADV